MAEATHHDALASVRDCSARADRGSRKVVTLHLRDPTHRYRLALSFSENSGTLRVRPDQVTRDTSNGQREQSVPSLILEDSHHVQKPRPQYTTHSQKHPPSNRTRASLGRRAPPRAATRRVRPRACERDPKHVSPKGYFLAKDTFGLCAQKSVLSNDLGTHVGRVVEASRTKRLFPTRSERGPRLPT